MLIFYYALILTARRWARPQTQWRILPKSLIRQAVSLVVPIVVYVIGFDLRAFCDILLGEFVNL